MKICQDWSKAMPFVKETLGDLRKTVVWPPRSVCVCVC